MATILLTAVGTALGGPIGAAVGATIGYAADARLFAPKARHGPRLGDLAVQGSAYGVQIPKLFGTMRVAGTVIWSTDLQERRSTSGGGKGRPKTVNYSYSASFAVALSGRPIRSVGRIWADGKLLRGAAGDFKTETGFRLHLGREDQEPDPLIAAAEGLAETPAHRGVAYAMFEDFQLGDYGNRIPSLSFEVAADAGPVSIGAIAEDLSGGTVLAGATPTVQGYAASGNGVRGAIEALATLVPLSLVTDGERLRLMRPIATGAELAAPEGLVDGAGATRRDELSRQSAASIPAVVTLAYHEVTRDFQAGLQRAFRSGPALLTEQIALSATLGAADARGFAEARLAAAWAARASATLHRSARLASLRPGALVRITGQAGLWRVERWLLESMTVRLQLTRVPGGGPAEAQASPGRAVAEPDVRHGPTVLRLAELPASSATPGDRPRLVIAAAGTLPGWRRAALIASFDEGASWQELGGSAAPAVMGTAETALAPNGSALFDLGGSVVVRLLHPGMMLESRTDAALTASANSALIGDEIVQFGLAEPLGAGRFRLSRLLRGRLGTEWASSGHVAGEAFLLLDRETLLPLDAPAGSTGGGVRVIASGLGDGVDGVETGRTLTGEGLKPPSPVHLRTARTESGDLRVSWVRRSRGGWTWADGADAPLGEESELYEVMISGAGFSRQATTATSAYIYTAADQVADGASGALRIAVVQIGSHARSRETVLTI